MWQTFLKRSVQANVYQYRAISGRNSDFFAFAWIFRSFRTPRSSHTQGKVFGNRWTRKKWSRSLISRISRRSRPFLIGNSSDFQRFWLLIKGIANKIILLAIPLIRSQNRWKSELFPIKNGRDRREIRDIRLRNHFFRVQRLPKVFPCVWEVVRLRKLGEFQANVKLSRLRPYIAWFWYTFAWTDL